MSYPHYNSHVGSKVNKFDGIIYYLKDFKNMVDKKKETYNKRKERIGEQRLRLELELNNEKKNIEAVSFLKKCIDENVENDIKESAFLNNNMTILLLDICEVLL